MNAPVNGFSANSKNLKSFRLQQKLRGLLILVAIAIPVLGGFFVYQQYKTSSNPATVAVEAPISDSAANTTLDTTLEAPATAVLDTKIPDGVSAALSSIEKTGLKDSTYVTVDTSTIPAGSTVQADRASWIAYDTNLGSVSGTISYKGNVKKSSITFQLINGAWKVTGYSIET